MGKKGYRSGHMKESLAMRSTNAGGLSMTK